MAFIANSEKNRREMLQEIGIGSFEELIEYIPANLRLKENLEIPRALSELEITRLMQELSEKNVSGVSFLGGGAYDHFVPAVVRHILWRSEFYTAYTPYQAEVSQGTLQSIYEYQSMIARLTGMEVANASMYDGGSALAESVLMASGHTRRKKVLIAENINPFYYDIIKTYTRDQQIELVGVPLQNGLLDQQKLAELLDEQTAAVVVQNPNYYGLIEELSGLGGRIHEKQALFIQFVDAVSLGILKTPGETGADIVVSEGQGFGNNLNFGGPYLGIFAARKSLIRKMPGRIVALTNDVDGRQAFVTTLQTREQHIRREKATSNICTNSQLCALAAAVYLSLLGRSGLQKTAKQCLQKSHYLAKEISKLPGFELKHSGHFFKEFVVKTPVEPKIIIDKLADRHIFAGIDLQKVNMGEGLLVAVTEKRTREEMDRFVRELSNLN
ncbi:MAG: aminomethyl-transferring glycine dehydrogenase subunit GcvPA [Calditrichia bacterium]